MSATDWQLSLKLVDQPKSTFTFPEMMPGDVPPGGYRVATLKQLVAAQLPDSIPDPDLIGQCWLVCWLYWQQLKRLPNWVCSLYDHIRAGALRAQTQRWPDPGRLRDSAWSHHTHLEKDLAGAREQSRCLEVSPAVTLNASAGDLNVFVLSTLRACEQSDCSQRVPGISRCPPLPQFSLQRFSKWRTLLCLWIAAIIHLKASADQCVGLLHVNRNVLSPSGV